MYWLVLAAVLISAGNAIVRNVFDMSSNAWLELQWYLFSAVFLLCAGYTLLHNEHIRIDVVAGRLLAAHADLDRHLRHRLLPAADGRSLIICLSWPMFVHAWIAAARCRATPAG